MSEPSVELGPREPRVGRAILILALWVAVWAGDALWGATTWFFHDLRHHHYPWRAWAAQVWGAGEVPLWAPVAHGYPLLADGQAGLLYPVNIALYQMMSAPMAFNWSVILHLFGAAVGGYYLARVLGRSVPAALVAATAYGFSGFLITHLLYLGMFQVIAWVPWMVALALRGVDDGKWWWGCAGLATGMAWLCGHPQLALYGTYAMVFVVGWTLIERARGTQGSPGLAGGRPVWRDVAIGSALMVLIAVGIAGPQLYASWELAQMGYREGGVDEGFASMGGLPVEELVGALFHSPLGYERPADIAITYHHRAEGYVGRGVSYLEDCFYLGVPVVMLALAAGIARRARVWWGLALAGVIFMLGDFTPFFQVFRLLPGMEWFRFPVRAALWVTLAGSQLAAIGVDRIGGWLQARPERATRRSRIALAIVLLGLVVGGLGRIGLDSVREPLTDGLTEALVRPPPTPEMLATIPAGAPPPEERGPEEARQRATQLVDELSKDITPWSPRVAWPALLALGLILLVELAARGTLSPGVPGRAVSGLIIADLFLFGYAFNPRVPTERAVERPPSAVPMLGVPGVFRSTVVDRRVPEELDRLLLSSNLGMMHGLEDVIIPSPLRLVRNEHYLAAAGLDLGIVTPEEQLERLAANRKLADLSGLRFLFTTRELGLPDLSVVWSEDVTLSDGSEHTVRVYENERALPRAFAVGCAVSVEAGDGALEALLAIEDLGGTAVVEGPVDVPCTPGVAGNVVVRRTSASGLRIEVAADSPGWLVITESMYPGQVVTLDGEQVTPVRTDYLFQGIALEPGEHVVTFRYRPTPLFLLMGLSLLVTSGSLAWVVVGWRRRR